MLEINYIKEGKKITQNLNIYFEKNNLGIDFTNLKRNLKKVKSITSAYFINMENNNNYSLLDNQKLIYEIILFLNSICHKFSLVIKQNDDGKNVIIHYLYRSYNHTEITIGDRTFASYLPIEESIQFAEQLFSNAIK